MLLSPRLFAALIIEAVVVTNDTALVIYSTLVAWALDVDEAAWALDVGEAAWALDVGEAASPPDVDEAESPSSFCDPPKF